MIPQLWLSLAALIAQIMIGCYVYGKLTGKVAEHDRRHASHDTRFDQLTGEQERQWESIGRQGERISAVEARVQGLRPH